MRCSHSATILIVNVISNRGLMALLKGKSPDVVSETITWYRTARASRWRSLEDVRRSFPDADQVNSVLIFNIRGNRYRLIVTEVFSENKIYLKALLTHKEYDRKEWLKWA
jgi:mRNA interferase HigB